MNATAATTSQPPRVMAAVTCLVLAVSYSISLLIAGHGVIPIGLALFMFADEATKGLEYPLTTGAVSAGWAGLAVLLLSLTCLRALRVHILIRRVAALLLFASWLCFALLVSSVGDASRFSSTFFTHVCVSLQFHAVFGFVIYRSIRVLRKAGNS